MLKWGEAIDKELLENLYLEQGLSAQEIADKLGISHHKVVYWMDKHGIQRRDWSEASYLKHNPDGEKFRIDLSDRELFVIGIALYLGEGDKRSSTSLVFVNSDSGILKLWLRFLERICNVSPDKLKAHISYYEDLSYPALLSYWSEELKIPHENFERPTLKRGKVANGNFDGRRSLHGTVHIRFHDSRLKSLMVSWMEDLLEGKP